MRLLSAAGVHDWSPAALAAATHDHGGASPLEPWRVFVECAVVLAVVVVVGATLLRPFTGTSGRWSALPAAVAGVTGTACLLVLLGTNARLPSAMPPPAVGALGVGLALIALVTAALPDARRLGRSAAWVALVCAAVALFLLVSSLLAPVAPGQRTMWWQAGTLLGIAALGWSAVSRTRSTALRRTTQAQAAVLSLALLAGLTPGAGIAGEPPPPGFALSARVAVGERRVEMLVVPHRPGINLVHSPEPGLAVSVGAKPPVPLRSKPGADGGWALVRLPEGAGSLQVHAADQVGLLPFDAGRSGPGLAVAESGGAECASVALGSLVGGATRPLVECPDARLGGADRAALDAVVSFLAARGIRALAVAGGSAPRSVAADAVVRAASTRHGIDVLYPGAERVPLLIVGGWSEAEEVLSGVATGALRAEGAYLAPWLFADPLLRIPAGQLIPLSLDPKAPDAQRYLAELQEHAPGATPTWSGYRAWRAVRDDESRRPFRMYATSLVSLDFGGRSHHGEGARWLPGGAATPVSGSLVPDTG
ncbi:DUF6239 family natural product biosynthesis protein [Saccharopolyspora sp. CA-218241]|uniref:DUF6239 family natural product biosynthesis protein n=1 Tax=Saccharopolyspora sp. CA-218241 TaxID=3240027 RepID=UPI003D99CDD7